MINLFGTDGIRNTIGHYPFTQEGLPLFGSALARWALETYGEEPCFLVGRDTRYSGSWIKAGISSGLLRYPVAVYDAGVLPTPAIPYLLETHASFTLGVVITASHNPATDNGIKLFSSAGKLTAADEEHICALMTEIPSSPLNGKEFHFLEGRDQYKQHLIDLCSPNFLSGRTIVLDCANGASSKLAPAIFRELGAIVIALNIDPDGHNINDQCGATAPSSLQEAVLKHHAFMGFGFDGDADRVVAVASDGTLKEGDDLLAVLATHPDYASQQTYVSTIMANYGLTAHFERYGKKLLRTDVGDKYIAHALAEHKLMLGAEPSGHIILSNVSSSGDGILAALKVAEAALLNNNHLLYSFIKAPQSLINLPIRQKIALTDEPLASIIAARRAALSQGRIVVRYSGTEPLLRILAEGEDAVSVESNANLLAHDLQKILS